MNVEADPREAIALLDRFGESAGRFVKPAAKVTADNIADGARTRVRRRTGATAAGIQVKEDFTGDGYVVVSASRPVNLPAWLEFGTRTMQSFPYLFNSARLEEGPHLRRIEAALQDAADEADRG
jgi:hypothetical protein